MNLFVILSSLLASGQIAFERHDIDDFPGGYQVAVADVNCDGRSDVIALSTQADRVDSYENPSWHRRAVARTARNIDLAAHDLDGDGRLELALATGFYFDDSKRGGEIFVLRQPSDAGDLWPRYQIAIDPVVHRVRWGDLDGDGRKELVHAPLFGPGSSGARSPKPAHLWAFQIPTRPDRGKVQVWKIDETLTVLHGLYVADLDGDGRDEILTASFEGLFRFDLDGQPPKTQWKKAQISAGATPMTDKPGAPRGSSEVIPVRFADNRMSLAAIEPWHGNQVVVYTQEAEGGSWQRHVLDDTLREGHALVAADFDADGVEEIVAGWRGGKGGLRLYDPLDAGGTRFRIGTIDEGIAVEGAVAADINLDGRLDLVAIGGRTNELAWYENRR